MDALRGSVRSGMGRVSCLDAMRLAAKRVLLTSMVVDFGDSEQSDGKGICRTEESINMFAFGGGTAGLYDQERDEITRCSSRD